MPGCLFFLALLVIVAVAGRPATAGRLVSAIRELRDVPITGINVHTESSVCA
jgi:hypothetical protein